MEPSELRRMLEVVKTAALKASKYVLSEFGQDRSVQYKVDGSPFTTVDVTAENMACADLAAAYPSVTIVGEEMQADKNHLPDLQSADFFLIDALDGTKEFITRSKDFTINVAFVRNGASILGVVIAPAHQVAYWGGVGLGAFKAEVVDGCVLHGTEPIRVNKARARHVMLSRSRGDTDEVKSYLSELGECTSAQLGSSLKSCWIAEGRATHYPCFGDTYEWDTAASQAILEAAGGEVRLRSGGRLAYGKTKQPRQCLNGHFVASVGEESNDPGKD